MSHGFAANCNARTIDTQRKISVAGRPQRPLVIIGGPAELSRQEALCLSNALTERHAHVEVFRTDDTFRIEEFIGVLGGCSWFLLAVGEFPGRELEMLREVQRITVKAPKIGIICLRERVQTTARDHIGGIVDLIVRRSPLDFSLTSFTRGHHMMLAENLNDDECVRPIARAVVPDRMFNQFR